MSRHLGACDRTLTAVGARGVRERERHCRSVIVGLDRSGRACLGALSTQGARIGIDCDDSLAGTFVCELERVLGEIAEAEHGSHLTGPGEWFLHIEMGNRCG